MFLGDPQNQTRSD